MANQELEYGPFRINKDGFGNLYVHDMEEGLVFMRERVGQDKYNLTVIIEEDNAEYWKWMDSLSPEQPCGFQILDGISLKEWTHLSKEYIRNKRRGEQIFKRWIEKCFYAPLGAMLYEDSWIAESSPWPDAPKEVCDDFDRAYKLYREEHPEYPWFQGLNKMLQH